MINSDCVVSEYLVYLLLSFVVFVRVCEKVVEEKR